MNIEFIAYLLPHDSSCVVCYCAGWKPWSMRSPLQANSKKMQSSQSTSRCIPLEGWSRARDSCVRVTPKPGKCTTVRSCGKWWNLAGMSNVSLCVLSYGQMTQLGAIGVIFHAAIFTRLKPIPEPWPFRGICIGFWGFMRDKLPRCHM